MITNLVLFVFVAGAVTGLVVAGAIAWAKDLGLKMTWWKWLLTALWYVLLNFFVFLDFTMIGEGETGAGLKLLFFQGVFMIILFVGLVRILSAGREKRS
jgi:hypothetical protein